jgi:hypothetical protein
VSPAATFSPSPIDSLPASFERKEIHCRSFALFLNHVSDRPPSTRCFSMRRESFVTALSRSAKPLDFNPRVLDLVVDVTLLVPKHRSFRPNRTRPLSSSSGRAQQAEAA